MNRYSVETAEELRPASCDERPAGYYEYDVFFDLSAGGMDERELHDFLEALDGDAGLNSEFRHVIVATPAHLRSPVVFGPNLGVSAAARPSAVQTLHKAISRASSQGHHLAIISGAILPGNELLRRLLDEFDVDPMFGTAQPRFADAAMDGIWALPGNSPHSSPWPRFSRDRLPLLPDRVITPEFLAACIVIRREVVREMQPREFSASTVDAELGFLFSQARRRGYRNVVVNRVVLASLLSSTQVYPALCAEEVEQLAAVHPETSRVESWRSNLPQRVLETILARLAADAAADHPRMLLDCRGMSAQHNGTSHSMLGFLDGFLALDSRWEFDVLVSKAAARFFDLEQRYPKLNFVYEQPSDRYAVAIMLNQPFGIPRVRDLHRNSLIVLFNMLDTISWDIIYACDEQLDALWRLVARYADGLLYISHFSRDRFRIRFAPHERTAECVTYLSLACEDQLDASVKPDGPGKHILVFGNDYDHKDVRRTVQILSDAFPFNRIIAIGIEHSGPGNITGVPSGQIDHVVLHRFIADAQVIVLPSFYEGFGLPVMQGLAYGRPVLVRDSALWHELAPMLRMPGQLVAYPGSASLVETVGRILYDVPLDAIPQSGKLAHGESPLTWPDCARRVLAFAEDLLASADGRRWLEREEALRSLELLAL